MNLIGVQGTAQIGAVSADIVGPYAQAVAAAEAIWAARWTGAVPVLWHLNSSATVPSRVDTENWLHIAVEFTDEAAVAFGQGPGKIERELTGTVVIRVFAARGQGETQSLALLDAALRVYRSQRSGGFSVIGDMPLQQTGASDDGGWFVRTGIVAFIYRFRG